MTNSSNKFRMDIPSHGSPDNFGPAPLQASLTPQDRRVPAWLMSLCLHCMLFVALLIGINSIPRGGAKVDNRPGGIVLVDLQNDATEYLSEGETLVAETSTTQQSPPPMATASELPPDLPGIEAQPIPISGVGRELVDGLPGANQLLDGPAPNRPVGGRTTTDVFGIKGTGTRFVYVFDRSRSMEGYNLRPLLAARQALIRSIESLDESSQFQIIFYNHSTTVFRGNQLSQLHQADDETKRAAIQFVNSVRGDGGTDHINALKQAFLLRPDVIFFLTDAEGGFTAAELRDLSQLNRTAAVINAIEFNDRRGNDRSLEQLARENGGQYIFKDIRTLRLE